MSNLSAVILGPLYGIVALTCVYMARHYYFTLNRLFGFQRHPYLDIDTATWPSVTIIVAAHNEEKVIAHALEALLAVKYPSELLTILPVNDRSTDRTKEIIDEFARRSPGQIHPFHRSQGKPGKAAALKEAMELVKTDLIVLFDADYIPAPQLIQQLVSPYFDPEVGAVMGRVVPLNVGSNLLTRLLDLERAAGYQVDQQARMNLKLVPQYGGTVGSVRMSALRDVNGWDANSLTEDTDLTFRLLLSGWKTVYQNRAECYEEVPETWPVRIRQISRWAWGHNQALFAHSVPVMSRAGLTWRERLDGMLLLGVYAMSPITMVGWLLAVVAFYMGYGHLNRTVALLAVSSYAAVGNAAAFFEIAAATHLDYSRNRIRLLPLNFFGFVVSVISVGRAATKQFISLFRVRELHWDKTERFRGSA
jgi:cellulose synthase/poly-beta-1,6-N-acetylglucosamine synthase-like glycosyltransferase